MRLSLTVSALITGIAAVHYYYMRDFWIDTQTSPTAFRYIDWILTVPLMCVEFYLLTKPFGAKGGTLFKLIVASTFMLVTGYIGEAAILPGGSVLWGFISTIGYAYIVYEVFAGDVRKGCHSQVILLNLNMLCSCLGLHHIGLVYLSNRIPMTQADNWLPGLFSMDITYNIADAINKIGFGLVVYSVAVAESRKRRSKRSRLIFFFLTKPNEQILHRDLFIFYFASTIDTDMDHVVGSILLKNRKYSLSHN